MKSLVQCKKKNILKTFKVSFPPFFSLRKQIGMPGWLSHSPPTLDFGSVQDLTVRPHSGLHAVNTEPAWDSLHPSLCLTCTFSLFQNK